MKGQSLLELVIVAGVLLVVVSGLSITVVQGLKNSQFSLNQAQATKLAQQGIDNVRTARDRNCLVKMTSGINYSWYGDSTLTLIWDLNLGAAVNFKIPLNLSPCELNQSTSPDFSDGKFTRNIYLLDLTSTSKKVISEVKWQDASGMHSSKLVTILAQY